jgi:hypothetical protein
MNDANDMKYENDMKQENDMNAEKRRRGRNNDDDNNVNQPSRACRPDYDKRNPLPPWTIGDAAWI